MIPPAPADFWKQVIDRFAELIWERERKTGGALEGVRLQGTGMLTNAERAAMHPMERFRVPETMPTPEPPEAAE
jgi:hypothetical protein